MAGAAITIEVDDTAVLSRLDELFARMDRPSGFFKNAGEYLVGTAIKRNFDTETSPEGTPWARLTAATIRRREKNGQTPIRILRASGSSTALSVMTTQVSERELRVGTNAIHAAVHQFGAEKGAFGTDTRERSLPYGNIPARPYLGLSSEDGVELINIAVAWLES